MDGSRWVGVCFFVAFGLAIGVIGGGITVSAELAPGDPETTGNGSHIAQTDGDETLPVDTGVRRSTPTEQVPFGVRTVYGQGGLSRPSGGSGVTVAVLDTGVDRSHPDLESRVTLCRDFTGGTVRNTCADANGHGTHVAGTVAADGGLDGQGIYGVAPEADIYAFKTCNDDGRCATESLVNGIRTATDEGADVVVLSLGGRPEPRLGSAISYATSRGVVVVAAAGNTGPELESILYPAADSTVIGVGAVGPRSGERGLSNNYRVPDFSSRGVDAEYREADDFVDVSAPGVGVQSTLPDGRYGTKSGTSMAAPHVGGLAAKMLASPNPPETPAELRAALHTRTPRFDVSAGQHTRVGYDPSAGFGIPTAARPTPAVSVSPPVPTADEPFVLDGGDSRPSDSEIVSYSWDTTGDGAFDERGERIEITRPAETYQVRLQVRDIDGATASVTRQVRVNAPPVAAFGVTPDVPTEGEPVEFDAAVSHDPDGSFLGYIWDFSGDGETDTTGRTVETSFDEPGPRDVTLRVVDADGATDEMTRTMLVNDIPRVTVDRPSRIRAGQPTTLEAVIDNEYGETTVTWRFPDGSTRTGAAAAYEFEEGQNTVEVTIEDEFGAASTEQVTVRAARGNLTDRPLGVGIALGSAVVLAAMLWLRSRLS